jgi:Mg-chelatase subunit ChlD
MTNARYTHYILVVDRSGSMNSMKNEATAGIARFLSEQMTTGGTASVSLHQFDTSHDTIFDFTPLAVAAATPYTLKPRGGTALLDALGFAITAEGETLAKMAEQDRPGKVMVLIVTDGQENSSKEYTKQQIKNMITGQHDTWKWEFSYIGANVDAFAEAEAMGIAAVATMDYLETPGGQDQAWRGMSAASARYASGQSANITYTPEERKKAAEGKDS